MTACWKYLKCTHNDSVLEVSKVLPNRQLQLKSSESIFFGFHKKPQFQQNREYLVLFGRW